MTPLLPLRKGYIFAIRKMPRGSMIRMPDRKGKIENVNTFKPPNSSPTNTELFEVISQVIRAHHREALITTKMLSGYTESQLYRQLGITAYGWAPIYTTVEENSGVHGNNERITLKNVREGTREFYEVVSQIAR